MEKLGSSSLFMLVTCAVFFALVGCNEYPNRLGIEKIIAVEEHHATRIFVIYKDKNGSYYSDTIHQATTVTDGATTINPHDYLSLYGGKKSYGPLPGCEKEYQDYIVHKRTL
ncbi:MAG: hypothetical protein Q7T50_02660 [Candidatus Magasanikbacteria bacterium]|nr:hypothetical protein [Candidatus Magasanikbacteria bacterium]